MLHAWHLMAPPTNWHGPSHAARVMLWASVLARETEWLEPAVWAAACHDLRRYDDTADPEHGHRAAQWVRTELPGKLRTPPDSLDLIAQACHWHATEDADCEWSHPVLTILEDADALDRWRLPGDAPDPARLRLPAAHQWIDAARQLAERTADLDSPACIWAEAEGMGLSVGPLTRWAARVRLKEPARRLAAPSVHVLLRHPAARELLGDGPRNVWQAWGSRTYARYSFPGAAPRMTPNGEALLRSLGWVAAWGSDGGVCVAPACAADVPAEGCFHVTPAESEAGILRDGLLRGEAVGLATTGRADAARRIHVSFDPAAAGRWHTMLPETVGRSWALVRIDPAGITDDVYRDPVSETGYFLTQPRVAPAFLSVVRRWRPRTGTPAATAG